MDTQTVVVALIVSIIAPVVLSYLNGRQRKADKLENWAREDQVAARVLEVANRAATAQAQNASVLQDIHTLVNSDMTAARQAELTTTRLLILALKRIVDPDTATEEAIIGAEKRATELEQILADRLVAQRKVEAAAAEHAVSVAASAAAREPLP
jgi:hypothetical protein